MAPLKYKGSADSYSLDAADLKRHGVEGFTKQTWSADNNFTVEVSDDVAAKMVELMPDDWEIASSAAAAKADDESSDDDSSGDQDASSKRPKKPAGE